MLFTPTIEKLFQQIPLSLLEVWGSFAYILGCILLIFAFGGFTFHTGDQWRIGREWKAWDGKSFLSMGITFVLVWGTGFLGSFLVLVPGAQTFESLKDLTVFLCIVLFGYPALIVVPFAYGLSDFYEGIPLDFISDWWLGYFINPSFFWLALQLIGKCPDFKKARTWKLYLLFVLCFMSIEPVMWGFICSGKFLTTESYFVITPALFCTTLITWCMAPFAMLAAYPLARRFELYWAEIPGHVKQKRWRKRNWIWSSGEQHSDLECKTDSDSGVPIRFFILAPFFVTVLLVMGTTAYFSLKSSEETSLVLAEHLHSEIAEKINLKLEDHLRMDSYTHGGSVDLGKILNNEPASIFILDKSGKLLSGFKHKEKVLPVGVAFRSFSKYLQKLNRPEVFNFQFRTKVNSARRLSTETWLMQARSVGPDNELILLTAMPESYYLSGIRKGQSHSSLVFSAGLVLVLFVVGVLGAYVVTPIRRVSHGAHAISSGDLSLRIPGSKLAEMNTLSLAFNTMAESLQTSFQSITEKENRLNLAVNAGNLGIWEWDIRANWVWWNDLMFKHYDLDKRATLRYEDWLKIIVPEDHIRMDNEIKAALKGEKDFNTEFRVKWRDGSIHVLRAHSQMLRDETGAPLKMYGINYDITDRRTTEKELLLYRTQLEEVVARRTEALIQKSHELQQMTEKQAKAEVYEKIAQIFLSMRDYTNSPLQAQKFSIEILKKRCPQQMDIISSLEDSVQRLSNINRILGRLEMDFPHTQLMTEEEIISYLDMMEEKS